MSKAELTDREWWILLCMVRNSNNKGPSSVSEDELGELASKLYHSRDWTKAEIER